MRQLRFGVIGCGAVTERCHLPAFKKLTEAKVVAVVDRDIDQAKLVARRYNIENYYGNYEELYGKIDAALMATPNSIHADISCDLMKQGIHILCEKPMATSTSDIKRMIESAHINGVRLMAAQSRRFPPNVQFLKRLLIDNTFGKLTEFSLSLGYKLERWQPRTDFRLDPNLSGGGVLMDTGIHIVDLALWLLEEIPIIEDFVYIKSDDWEVEESAHIFLSFPSCTWSAVSCSYTHEFANQLVVKGEEGWAQLSVNDTNSLEFFIPRSKVCLKAGVQTATFESNDPYLLQLAHFCKNTLQQQPFLVRNEEVLAVMEIVENCYRRIKNGDGD